MQWPPFFIKIMQLLIIFSNLTKNLVMKKHVALLVMPCMLALQSAFAQADAHLKLSKEHPAAGEKITFTYDAAGTPLAGKAAMQAAVYYQDGKDYPVDDVNLQ